MMRIEKLTRPSLALLAMAVFIPAAACDGPLQPLPIQQKDPQSTQLFIGSGRSVTVEFVNESGRADVDSFPEPPMIIRQVQTGKSCEVDGGIWVRKSVHLSKDETVLMVQEYSGSSDALVFYDTSSCQERRRLDISGARWELTKNELFLGRSCTGEKLATCQRMERFEFDASCLPKPTRK